MARYRNATRRPTFEDDFRTLGTLVHDYQSLLEAGHRVRAVGAGLLFIDIALRIAATPAPTAEDRAFKVQFFETAFPSAVASFSQVHVARLADAAVAAEAGLGSAGPRSDRSSPSGSHSTRHEPVRPAVASFEERLPFYEKYVSRLGDLNPTLTTLVLVSTDLASLKAEGRTSAAEGAAHVLDAAVRRLCATKAPFTEQALAKVAALASARQSYDASPAGPMMAAMIDAAILLESEWSTDH